MTEITWIKSSRSNVNGHCVEIASTLDTIRDSKDPHGPHLHTNVTTLVRAIKAGRYDREEHLRNV